MNISIWEGTSITTHTYPQLNSSLHCDVVIVGGGISGLTCAQLLADAGKKVVVLEAMKIGLGTTGNSTGNLYATIDEHLSTLKKKWGEDVARAVVTSRTAALSHIEYIVKRNNINCDFTRTGFHLFLEKENKEQEELMEKELEALHEFGLNPIMDSSSKLPFKVVKALTVPNQAQFHPLNYARGLAQSMSRNCTIYENSPVTNYDEEKGIVNCGPFTVTADYIVMATHVPKGIFAVQTVLGPYREFGVAAVKTGAPLESGIYWGMDQPKHSVRSYKNGNENYVMVIGDKFKTGHPQNHFEYVDHLESYLRDHFGVSEMKYIWGGQQYRPADGLPYIGNHSEKLFYLTGFSTDGLIYGTLGAMIISEKILGRQSQWEEIYNSSRHTPVKSAKEFIKENADNIMQYIKDIPFKVDAKDVEHIAHGEGKIIQKENEKIAVYKDENGNVSAVSAVCTHMKCIVHFNQTEKTWDCPCHGSRFKVTGEVIEGPAIQPLQGKSSIANK